MDFVSSKNVCGTIRYLSSHGKYGKMGNILGWITIVHIAGNQ